MDLAAFFLFRLIVLAAGLQTNAAAGPPEKAPATPTVYGLEVQAMKAYEEKHYAESESSFAAAFSAGLNRYDDYYNAACSSALAGHISKAVEYLQHAAALGFHDSNQVKSDPDLSAVRPNAQFPTVLRHVEDNERIYEREHGDPERAAIVTSDIDLFWSVLGVAMADPKPSVVLENEYFCRGSPGLQDFIFARIHSGEDLWNIIKRAPRYYASLRESSNRIKDFTRQIRASFHKLKDLYPLAIFPDIYFLIGRMNSAGTVGPSGLLIGADMFGKGPNVPLDELSEWHRNVIAPVTNIPATVAHELIHYQQKTQGDNLLAASIREGSADFIAELISGEMTNGAIRDYGISHERELWTEFSRDMHGTDKSHWMYQGTATKGRPADLAYFMGYRITQAYYDDASNKKKAIFDIVNFKDAEQFLRASGYPQRFTFQ